MLNFCGHSQNELVVVLNNQFHIIGFIQFTVYIPSKYLYFHI